MRKKRNVFIILIIMVLVMSGCGKQSIDIDMETTGESLDYEEVGSSYTRNIGIALMDTGFYYQNKYTQLMYYDYKSGQVTFVCSKPNCKHDRMDCECDANIHGDDFPMNYRNGRLYYISTVKKDSSTGLVMFSVKSDGSDRKKECEVAEVDDNSNGYNIELYKQYVIFKYNINDMHQTIELIDTDMGEKRLLYNKDDKSVRIHGPFVYYDYIYYGEKERDKQGKEISETLYRCNLKTKEISKVYEGMIKALTFAKGYLIFSDGEAINRMPLSGGKIEQLFNYKGNGDLKYDGQYLYIEHPHDYLSDVGDQQAKCDDHWVDVMKLDGTKVDTIEWNNRGDCLFGDQHMLLFDRVQEGDGIIREWVMMKKSDIGGKHHFIDLANGKPYEEK